MKELKRPNNKQKYTEKVDHKNCELNDLKKHNETLEKNIYLYSKWDDEINILKRKINKIINVYDFQIYPLLLGIFIQIEKI